MVMDEVANMIAAYARGAGLTAKIDCGIGRRDVHIRNGGTYGGKISVGFDGVDLRGCWTCRGAFLAEISREEYAGIAVR